MVCRAMRLPHAIAATVLCALMVLPATAAADAARHNSIERAVVKRVNDLRAQKGVRPLKASRPLARAAASGSATQLRRGRLSHEGFAERIQRYLHARILGETLAWLSGGTDNLAAAVVANWMSSPPHKRELLSGDYKRIGVGELRGTMDGARGTVFTVNLASGR